MKYLSIVSIFLARMHVTGRFFSFRILSFRITKGRLRGVWGASLFHHSVPMRQLGVLLLVPGDAERTAHVCSTITPG